MFLNSLWIYSNYFNKKYYGPQFKIHKYKSLQKARFNKKHGFKNKLLIFSFLWYY